MERDFRSYLRCGILADGFARVLDIFVRALRAALRDASPGAPAALRDSQLGAISFPQRFGSSLNHTTTSTCWPSMAWSSDVEHGVRFHGATALDARHAEALAQTVQLRVLRWFARCGLMAPATAADMRTWQGIGGFSVDGSERDSSGSFATVRAYPIALERLHGPAGIGALSSEKARLVYRLPEPDVNGR